MGLESFQIHQSSETTADARNVEVPELAGLETEAKIVMEERGKLLQRVIERILGAREYLGEKVHHLGPGSQKVWSGLKEIPFVRSAVFVSEGALKNEPGRTLNTGDILKKYATAGVTLAADWRELLDEKEAAAPTRADAEESGTPRRSAKRMLSALSKFSKGLD